jgi:Ca2+/Na+ antiporter
MGNYVIFVPIAILYGLIAIFLSRKASPRTALGVHMQIYIQFAAITICCITPAWWPITTVLGWIAWCAYCLFMYAALYLQVSSARIRVINKTKVYDCHIIGIRDLIAFHGWRFVIGQIIEGSFVTPVVMLDKEAKERTGTIIKVRYNHKEGHFKKPTDMPYYDENYQKIVAKDCIIVTKVEL